MRDHRLLRIFCIGLILLTSSLTIYPQSTTSLRGVITDATGGVVPGAVVSLTNDRTGFKRQSLSGEDGVYQFVQAPPGLYQVTVEKTAETSDFVTYWIRITAVSTTATVAGNPG